MTAPECLELDDHRLGPAAGDDVVEARQAMLGSRRGRAPARRGDLPGESVDGRDRVDQPAEVLDEGGEPGPPIEHRRVVTTCGVQTRLQPLQPFLGLTGAVRAGQRQRVEPQLILGSLVEPPPRTPRGRRGPCPARWLRR